MFVKQKNECNCPVEQLKWETEWLIVHYPILKASCNDGKCTMVGIQPSFIILPPKIDFHYISN